jgi:20S proteasome alpha/beta subunit
LQIREYLEKNYGEEAPAGQGAIKLCVKSLMEMVEASGQTIEIMVLKKVEGLGQLVQLAQDEIDAVVREIEADNSAAEAARRSQLEQQQD